MSGELHWKLQFYPIALLKFQVFAPKRARANILIVIETQEKNKNLYTNSQACQESCVRKDLSQIFTFFRKIIPKASV